MRVPVMIVAMPMRSVAVVMVVAHVTMLVMRLILAVVERFAGRASQVVAGGIVLVGMFVHLLYSTQHKGVAPSWQLTMRRGRHRLAIRRM
jgi:hypothetical protein